MTDASALYMLVSSLPKAESTTDVPHVITSVPWL